MSGSRKFVTVTFFTAVIYYILAYIIPLGSNMPLITPDETRYAEIAREMIVSGNWVVPKLLGIDYFEKPIMGYWMNAISELIFGYNNFAVRFASALSAGLTALLIFFFVKRFAEDKVLAPLSALIYLGFGMVYGIGTFSVLDSQTTLFISGALITFYFGYSDNSKFSINGWLAICGIFTGCAFMTKGFIAFAVMAVAIAPFLIWQKEWKKLLTMAWVPIIFAVLISLPWALAINKQSPDFWRYFFFVEHYDRFFNASIDKTQFHTQPFWFFIPIIIGGMLPWAFHLPTAIAGFKRKYAFRMPFFRYLACWTIFPFIFFSGSSGKLATYILPCLPALSILTAYGIYWALEFDGKDRIFNITNKVLSYIFILAVIGLVIYQVLAYFISSIPMIYTSLPGMLFAILAVLVMAFLYRSSSKAHSTMSKLILFAIAPLFVMLIRPEVTPDMVTTEIAQGQFVTDASKYISPDTIILAHMNMMHAVAWYLKRSDIYLWDNPGELEYGTDLPQYKYRLIRGKNGLKTLIEEQTGKGGVATFMRGDFQENFPIKATNEAYQNRLMFGKFD